MQKITYFLLFLIIIGCKSQEKKPVYEDILIQNRDSTIDPASDFFMYANGGWIKKNPIPESERSRGIAKMVMDETYDRMRELSEDAAGNKSAEPGSSSQKIGDFYSTGMDSATSNAQGFAKLQPWLDSIEACKNISDILGRIAQHQIIGCNPLFNMSVYQDEMNSEKMALHLSQGGIGLPNRDYYFNDDSRTKNIRNEYVVHVANVFKLLGEDETMAGKHAQAVMKLETQLARSSRKLEDLRDPYENYNKMDLKGLNQLNPSMNFRELFTVMNLEKVDTVIVGQPEFYSEVEKQLKATSIDDWKTYLRWNLIASFSAYLSQDFEAEQFHFNGEVVRRKKTAPPLETCSR